MVEPKISDAHLAAAMGQLDLFGRIAATVEAVGTDDQIGG
jgi:hypothetical protein